MTAAPVPDRPTLPRLRTAVQDCRACEVKHFHPSSVLRARSDEEREAAFGALVDDLRAVAAALDAGLSRGVADVPGRVRAAARRVALR